MHAALLVWHKHFDFKRCNFSLSVSDLYNRDIQEWEWTSRNQTAKKMIQKLQVSKY